MNPSASPRILVIRRDNIGDLVCTTPAIAALRLRYPKGRIAVLVNTYNEAVLAGNPDIDSVYAYQKGKHRGARSILSVYADRLRLLITLRRERFDYAILATPGFSQQAFRFAQLIGPRHVVGYAAQGGAHPGIDIALPYDRLTRAHEVEQVFALLQPLGIEGSPPSARVLPDVAETRETAEALSRLGPRGAPVVGIHISARRSRQQWPAENFAKLIRSLAQRHALRFLLLWSPGDQDNPTHPGDDEKARAVLERCAGLPILACPTVTLSRLIAILSLCDCVVCADGGAMHLAAALAKPILCFFGDSPPERWRPWKTPHELLQPPSRDVRDLGVEEVAAGFDRLMPGLPPAQPLP